MNLFHLEDWAGGRNGSFVGKARSFARAIQELAGFVALPLNGGNLSVNVLGVAADVELVSELLEFLVTSLRSEVERFAKSLDLLNPDVCKQLYRVVVHNRVCLGL